MPAESSIASESNARLPLVRAIWLGWMLAAGANAFIAWGATGLLLTALALSLAPLVVWSICGAVVYLCLIIRPRGSAPYGQAPMRAKPTG
jgi:hypothetical protein